MVLGNTFHLHLDPGDELVARLRRPARVHGLGPADHHRLRRLPGLLDGPRHRGRRDQGPHAERADRGRGGPGHRGGGRALPLLPRRLRALPGAGDVDGDPGQPGLGHRAGVRRVHAFHADRDYTARSTERTHRWLRRCLDWHAAPRPATTSSSTASSRAACTRTCASSRPARSPPARSTAWRSGARWAPTRRRCTRSSAGRPPRSAATPRPAAPPARHRRGRRPRPRDRARDRHLRLRDAHAPGPSRDGARARPEPPLARRPRPRRAGALSDEPLMDGCPCPACAQGYTRGYLRYLAGPARRP